MSIYIWAINLHIFYCVYWVVITLSAAISCLSTFQSSPCECNTNEARLWKSRAEHLRQHVQLKVCYWKIICDLIFNNSECHWSKCHSWTIMKCYTDCHPCFLLFIVTSDEQFLPTQFHNYLVILYAPIIKYVYFMQMV